MERAVGAGNIIAGFSPLTARDIGLAAGLAARHRAVLVIFACPAYVGSFAAGHQSGLAQPGWVKWHALSHIVPVKNAPSQKNPVDRANFVIPQRFLSSTLSLFAKRRTMPIASHTGRTERAKIVRRNLTARVQRESTPSTQTKVASPAAIQASTAQLTALLTTVNLPALGQAISV